MCSSEFSTSWIPRDHEAEASGLKFREFTSPYRRVARVSPALLEEILESSGSLDLVIVKGGEPTRDPRCLDFLERLAHFPGRNQELTVFMQTNGTRNSEEWLPKLAGLRVEVGISLDGWGDLNNWIRGSMFESVLRNLVAVSKSPNVRRVAVDFALSAFNCLHLPIFVDQMNKLAQELPKLDRTPSFQWVQEHYASPLALHASDREEVSRVTREYFSAAGLDAKKLERVEEVLSLPQLAPELVSDCRAWLLHLEKVRGQKLPEGRERLLRSFEGARTVQVSNITAL
jgi:hypothetical protein